jgi:sulfite reductase (ferredoxin)
VPSKNIPAVVDRLAERFVRERQGTERFQEFCQRIGKKALKAMIDEFTKVPAHGEDASYYSDWGDPREYTTGDMGTGECAGEVVSLVEFDLADAEREVFEAQLLLESGDNQQAETRAYHAMLKAAKALVRTRSRMSATPTTGWWPSSSRASSIPSCSTRNSRAVNSPTTCSATTR